jgi:Bacterial protein of unknown function (DUF885)
MALKPGGGADKISEISRTIFVSSLHSFHYCKSYPRLLFLHLDCKHHLVMHGILKSHIIAAILLFGCATFPARGQTKLPDSSKAWIAKSNHYTQMLTDIVMKYQPEFGSIEGLAQYDTLIQVPTLANYLAEREEIETLAATYTAALQSERDPHLGQDLTILVGCLKLYTRQLNLILNRKVSYYDAASEIYSGVKGLLDDQTPPERRVAVIKRLKKYAGLLDNYRPITAIWQEDIEKQMAGKDMIYPSKKEIELGISRSDILMGGIADLCKKYNPKGWEQPYALLKKQVDVFNQWMRDKLLPLARTDFRLAPEEYDFQLAIYGIDVTPSELATMGHAAFTEIQEEMKPIAQQIAKKRGFSSDDYRDVIRELKKEQLHGDSILLVFRRNLAAIENIIRQHALVTLPDRPVTMRLATPAETVENPSPQMIPPALLNNTGQHGVFLLPLNMPSAPGDTNERKFDDDTYDAASWSDIAHEARPGHELQFDKMVEEGVSTVRAVYAFNSTNVEGWALYSEYIMVPYMPSEGQLITLDFRLLRAARAFLDPELQAGTISLQQAHDVLVNDVVTSEALAQEEVERYTVKMPGQANSYLYGFTKLIALRKEAELALGVKFKAQHFHDFILSQGLLPPDLMRAAVLREFIPAENGLLP